MEHWRRNLYMAWLSQLLCILGFSSAFPFIPFYLQELGVVDPDQLKLWSGWITTGGSLTMAIFAPIWGTLADRYGRKIMVQRAAFGGAFMITLIAFTTSASQLLVLRTVQGALTGTVAAFVTLVASTTPREQAGFSLGLMQVAVFIGSTGGPLVGGLVADSLGYRAAFVICGIMLFFGGVLAWRFVEERFTPRSSRHTSFWRVTRSLLSQRTVLVMTVVIFSLYMTSAVLRPILPLFIQSLASQQKLATTTGLIQGAGALSSALAAAVIGKVSDRLGHRRVLLLCSLGAAASYLPQTLVTTSTQLLVLNVIMGIFVGGLIPATNAIIALTVDEGKQGATYGLTASAGAAGRAVGPMIGSSIAIYLGMRALFPFMAALYVIVAVWIFFAVPLITRKTDQVSDAKSI